MFLTRKLNAFSSDDRGSALMAVLGVMAVTVVIGLTITATTINGLGVTSSNKSLVQSRAAAEAGVAVVAAGLSGAATCPATFASAGNPKYSATVAYLNASGVVVSCTIAIQVKITSTGTSQSNGVNGASSGDTSVVEAVYPYTPALTPGIVPSGAAIYLANGANFNNGGLIESAATVPAIQVKTGNLGCDNNTTITGNVVVVTGSISLKKCTIGGDAWAFGTATFPPPGGTITGMLRASGTRPSAQPLVRWAPTMPMPSVPAWTEFGYNRNDWVTSAGVPFNELVKPTTSSDCALPRNNGTSPVIFNALNCAGVSDSGDVTLYNDLVVVANKFDFGNSLDFVSSNPAIAHRVWFITPDLAPADGVATCSAGQGAFTIGNQLKVVAPVSAMLYTPCAISTGNGFTWRGQMYAGTISNWNNANFGYVGIGLPGANLADGTYTPGGSSGSPSDLGALVSSRDVVG